MLIEKYIEWDERLKDIIYFLVLWASKNQLLNDSEGYLTKYAFLNMIIFFFQIKDDPLIPVLDEVIHKRKLVQEERILNYEEMDQRPKNVPDSEKYSFPIFNSHNVAFKKLKISELKESLGFKENTSTTGFLILEFFFYFSTEFPVRESRN